MLAQISTFQIIIPGNSVNKRNVKEGSILFLGTPLFLQERTAFHFSFEVRWNIIQHFHHKVCKAWELNFAITDNQLSGMKWSLKNNRMPMDSTKQTLSPRYQIVRSSHLAWLQSLNPDVGSQMAGKPHSSYVLMRAISQMFVLVSIYHHQIIKKPPKHKQICLVLLSKIKYQIFTNEHWGNNTYTRR